jgi:transcriptional regulator with XRE-family HTH domain
VPNNPATATSGPTKLAVAMEKARKERGVTQGQLAERLHIRQAMVSMIEGGEADYGDELAGRIRGWIESGSGASKKPARGPYKTRSTIQGR